VFEWMSWCLNYVSISTKLFVKSKGKDTFNMSESWAEVEYVITFRLRGGKYFPAQRWKVTAGFEYKQTMLALRNLGSHMPRTNGKTTRKDKILIMINKWDDFRGLEKTLLYLYLFPLFFCFLSISSSYVHTLMTQ
jgi:hypothetical protein